MEEQVKEITNNIENTKENTLELPLIALRGKVLFPKTLLNFDVGRPFSVKAIDVAMENRSLIFISAQMWITHHILLLYAQNAARFRALFQMVKQNFRLLL